MMHRVSDLQFFDSVAAERELARTKAEIGMVNWLRAQARDRSHDAARGGPRWYLVAVRPGREVALAVRLLRYRIRAFCPRERLVEKLPRGNGKRIVRRVMYDGYLFVQTAPWEGSWAGVLSFEGVQRLLPVNERPMPVADAVIVELQRLSRLKPHKAASEITLYIAGDEVRIKRGPFAEFKGVASGSEDDRGRLKVDVAIFGREVSCEVWLDQVQKLR